MPKEETTWAAPLSSSVYPGSTEYAVLMNRFKLLNLVQRVAHRDVMEMIDTVGLEVLAYKGGARQRWMGEDGAESDEADVSDSESRSFTARAARRRGQHEKAQAGARAHRGQAARKDDLAMPSPAARRPARLTRTQERRLLHRLTQPRRSPGPSTPRPLTPREQHWRRAAYAPTNSSEGDGYSSDFSDEDTPARPTAATLARELLRPARTAAADVQPLPPAPTLRGQRHTPGPTPTTGAATGRTLPLEAIQHAAATLLARHQQQQPQHGPPPATTFSQEEHVYRSEVERSDQTEGLARPSLTAQEVTMPFASSRLPPPSQAATAMTTRNAMSHKAPVVPAVPSSTQTSPPPPPGPPQQTLHELSNAIDAMLDDHMRVLNELVREPVAGGGGTGDAQPCVEVEMTTTDAEEDEGEKFDEVLLLSRLHEKVAHMDDEMVQIAQRSSAIATVPPVQSDTQTVVAHEGEADAVVRRPPRRRGAMPEAVVRRLTAHRIENYEYIAHNERLWNTSSTSQFVFAQRLTNALFEDCLDEVLAEVAAIMDNYVEGLAEHELRQ